MQTRWKEMAIWLPILAVALLVYSEYFPLYPSDQLDDYPTANGVVLAQEIEEFFSDGSDFYEYAIYLENDRRFFVRQPEVAEFDPSIRDLKAGLSVIVSHLVDEEDGRGHRLVNVASGDRTIYSLDTALNEMRGTQDFIRLFSAALLLVGLASFFVHRHRRIKASDTDLLPP